jgi:DNA-binding NarL/FixJ family response regulator
MIRTLIADGSSVMRLGIRTVLDRRSIALEIDEAGSSAELMMRLYSRYYELIVIDPMLFGWSPETCVRQLRQTAPWSDVLLFTALDELTYGQDAILSGAKGYVMNTCSADELLAAVCRVSRGKVYLSRALAAEFAIGLRKYDARRHPHESFSKRELQVFSMAVCGMTTVESADVLQISTEIIKAFKDSVMDKLKIATRSEMLDYAISHGLTQDCRETCSALWSNRYCTEESA